MTKTKLSIEKDSGPSHERRYVCSAEIEMKDKKVFVEGEEKFRVKDAENSAASLMIRGLQGYKYL